jgi:hypothetical protein
VVTNLVTGIGLDGNNWTACRAGDEVSADRTSLSCRVAATGLTQAYKATAIKGSGIALASAYGKENVLSRPTFCNINACCVDKAY